MATNLARLGHFEIDFVLHTCRVKQLCVPIELQYSISAYYIASYILTSIVANPY